MNSAVIFTNTFTTIRRSTRCIAGHGVPWKHCFIITWRIAKIWANKPASVIRRDGQHRAVCDYLAGMTDRYALLEYERLFGVKI